MSNTWQVTRPSRESQKREISRGSSSQGLRAGFTGYRLERNKWLSREMWFNDWRTRGISGIKLITNGTYFPEVVRKPFHEVQPKKWPLENWVTFDFRGRLLVVLYNSFEMKHLRILKVGKEDLASWTNLVTRCLEAFRVSLWTWRPEVSHCCSALRRFLFASQSWIGMKVLIIVHRTFMKLFDMWPSTVVIKIK